MTDLYTPQTWANGSGGGTPINATRLGHIETGINALDAAIQTLSGGGGGGGSLISAKAFGAIGDGLTHPLSSVYGTLGAAQAVYPRATALTEEIDRHAIQKAVDQWPKTDATGWRGGRVTVEPGTYMIDDTIEVDRYFDLTLVCSGIGSTFFQSTPALDGKSMFRFLNCRRSGIQDASLYGNQAFTPAAMIEFREDHAAAAAAGSGMPSTQARLRRLHIGNSQAQNYDVGVLWTTARRDQNNDDAWIEDVDQVNYLVAAYQTTHSNALRNRVVGGVCLSAIFTAAAFKTGEGAGVSFANGVSNSTATYTSATAAFGAWDVGAGITGTNIAAGTTIAAVLNATTITLSQAATGTGSGLSFTIQPRGGGSFIGFAISMAIDGWLLDIGKGRYYKRIELDHIQNEPSASSYLVKALATSIDVRVLVTDSDFQSAIAGSTKFVDSAAPSARWEFRGVRMATAGGMLDFGSDADTTVRLTDWESNITTLRWGGKCWDTNHTDFSGAMVDDPQGNALMDRTGTYNGSTQAMLKTEFRYGSAVSRIFHDSATGQMKVTDVTSTRQV